MDRFVRTFFMVTGVMVAIFTAYVLVVMLAPLLDGLLSWCKLLFIGILLIVMVGSMVTSILSVIFERIPEKYLFLGYHTDDDGGLSASLLCTVVLVLPVALFIGYGYEWYSLESRVTRLLWIESVCFFAVRFLYIGWRYHVASILKVLEQNDKKNRSWFGEYQNHSMAGFSNQIWLQKEGFRSSPFSLVHSEKDWAIRSPFAQ